MLIKIEVEGNILRAIHHPEICTRAFFELDKPLAIKSNHQFVLQDGEWFVLQDEQVAQLNGRWKLLHG